VSGPLGFGIGDPIPPAHSLELGTLSGPVAAAAERVITLTRDEPEAEPA
jgi:hypothetical protein